MEVDNRLNFSEHIVGICKKSGGYINNLSRSSKTFDLPTKLVLMQNFALSYFNLCPTVWHIVNSVIL